jgi:Ca2+:H+ antiporter
MAEGNPGANPVTDAGTTPSPADLGTALCGLWKELLSWLVLALPVAVVLELLHAAELWIFMVSALAIVPLAGLMGRATENLAETLSAGIGGLLNATFGNAAELIIGLMALGKGPAMYPLVKASITGSIIGNILLVLGMAILVGGLYYPQQVFNRTAAGMGQHCWPWRPSG